MKVVNLDTVAALHHVSVAATMTFEIELFA